MTDCKCVPREITSKMYDALNDTLRPREGLIAEAWEAAYDAAPPCECEAERLLRELVEARDAYLNIELGAYARLGDAWLAIKAYLARPK